MMHSNRREFLKTTAGFLAFATSGTAFDFKKEKLKLAFSTLGCPDWTFDKIISFAAENDYSGIEVRGIQREMDLTRCKEFGPENLATTLRLMKDKGLKFVDLGSSAEMHHSDPAERQKQLDEARRFIHLAEQLRCPYVRVFPNKLSKEDRSASIDTIIKGLKEAGNYA